MKKVIAFSLALILMGCATKSAQPNNDLFTIQIIDRNGFSETISAKERLGKYENTDFLTSQPYRKVVRIYGKASQGKTGSKITTYHTNGHPWQYLEVENGRAHGKYQEWYPNGQLKIEGSVIEGTPDVSEVAQLTWFFEGWNLVYDEQGHLTAKIFYDKGLLEGTSQYFHPDRTLSQEISYSKGKIHGVVQSFDTAGNCLEKASYIEGEKDGAAIAYWTPTQIKFNEEYQKGRLLKGEYFNPAGEKIAQIENGEGIQAVFEDTSLASLIEYHQGVIDGEVKTFNPKGQLLSLYHIKDGMKQGEEWEYYPSNEKKPSPKLCLQWKEDELKGTAKTWYENGVLESQRELQDNKKHGTSFAWFKDGELMLMEEYENDQLIKGSYFKKWDKNPVSKIENGNGTATIFDNEGRFIKKIIYEKGLPQKEL